MPFKFYDDDRQYASCDVCGWIEKGFGIMRDIHDKTICEPCYEDWPTCSICVGQVALKEGEDMCKDCLTAELAELEVA